MEIRVPCSSDQKNYARVVTERLWIPSSFASRQHFILEELLGSKRKFCSVKSRSAASVGERDRLTQNWKILINPDWFISAPNRGSSASVVFQIHFTCERPTALCASIWLARSYDTHDWKLNARNYKGVFLCCVRMTQSRSDTFQKISIRFEKSIEAGPLSHLLWVKFEFYLIYCRAKRNFGSASLSGEKWERFTSGEGQVFVRLEILGSETIFTV